MTLKAQQHNPRSAQVNAGRRRWFLTRIVQGFSLTGLGFVTYPFIKAWLPSFAEDASLDVSIEKLKPGDVQVVRWRGRDLYVQRRTREMIRWLGGSRLALKDSGSEASQQPAFARNAYRSLRPDVFVTYNNCTHLGCQVAASQGEVRRQGIGFTCPCHQSEFDLAGRVVVDAAAPTNLEIPNYRFIAGNIIRLEEDSAAT